MHGVLLSLHAFMHIDIEIKNERMRYHSICTVNTTHHAMSHPPLLTPTQAATHPPPTLTTYSLHITTSNSRHAATDALVCTELIGSSSTSGRMVLGQGREGAFGRGCCDVFEVTCWDVGQVKALVLGHDGTGRDDGVGFVLVWFVGCMTACGV